MNVFHQNKDLAIIKLSRFELEILINSLQQVLTEIGDRGFSNRLAVSFEKKIGCKKDFLRRFFSKYHQFAQVFFALHPL